MVVRAMMGRIQTTRAARPYTSIDRETRHPADRTVDAVAAAVGLGLGACIGLAINAESTSALRAPGGWPTFFGRLAGLSGAYLMLVMVLLVARIPWVERAVGQARLIRWHRTLGQWPVYLIVLHATLVTIGYAQQDRSGLLHQFWTLIDTYPDVLASTVALVLIVVAAVLSVRQARRRMRYETWWTVHLYLYLALALAFSHQLANGASFVGHPLTRALWTTLWFGTAGVVLAYRVVLPVVRGAFHGLRVAGVQQEGPGVYSVVCSGRHLERLGIEGGQFFQWRFLARGLWWQAHPYSLSALPHSGYIRLTVKALGDHSRALSRIKLGTRVIAEGPYGAFTRQARTGDRVLLVGAGVGITPIRALLEHLDPTVDVTVLIRASRPEQLIFREELRSLVEMRGGRLVEMIGTRRKHPMDRRQLRSLVPDIAHRDVYVCGPESFSQTVIAAARVLGVPEKGIHCEQFTF
jgi:predicted ferric reductase